MEEVTALVLDCGTAWTRAGYSGEDSPQCVIPTQLGCLPATATAASSSPAGGASGSVVGWSFAESSTLFREHMDIRHPLDPNTGLVADWELWERLVDYVVGRGLRIPAREYPLLACEPVHSTREQREKMAELVFEKFQCPAFFLAKNPVLAAFAAGKSTALVLDCGHSHSTVVPVYEGYVLKKGISHQQLGGDFLNDQTLLLLKQEYRYSVTPQYKVLRRKQMELGKPSEPVLRKIVNGTASFDTMARKLAVQDFKETVCAVSEVPYNDQILSMRPRKAYEFPDGFNANYGTLRFRIPEILFDPQKHMLPNPAHSVDTAQFMGVPRMLLKCLESCDLDARTNLINNVVVTGGSSLFSNFAERLNFDVGQLMPGTRVKVFASGDSMERRFGNWIGGSMLASLGTFQQLWVSKQEFEEEGAGILEKRCQ